MSSYPENNLALPRQIVVSNLPVSANHTEMEGTEAAVQVSCTMVKREVLMDGAAGRLRVGTHSCLPTSNAGLYVTDSDVSMP